MIVGTMTVEIEIPHSNSLKAKRQVLNRIKDRVWNKFKVSIAEVDNNDIWNCASLGIAVVANDQKHANQVLSKIIEFIPTLHDFILTDHSMEFLHV